MGLFFNRKKKANEESAGAEPAKEVVLSGEREATVYIYYGEPLKHLTDHESVELEVMDRLIVMVSTATGTQHNASRGRDYALSYKGKPVGFMSHGAKEIERIIAEGYKVKITAKKLGKYMPGIPKIVAFVPEVLEMQAIVSWVVDGALDGTGCMMEQYVEHLLSNYDLANLILRTNSKFGARIPLRSDVMSRCFTDAEWTGPNDKEKTTNLAITTELIPTPKGSSAKPHVMVSVDGTNVFEASAKMECYKTLIKHVGEKPIFAGCARTGEPCGADTYCLFAIAYAEKAELT